MADRPMDQRLPSLTAVRKSEELPLTVGHQRMCKLNPGRAWSGLNTEGSGRAPSLYFGLGLLWA
jgi:hypothetical protein